jgi:ankyrin repeat domain-containing protein 50
LKSHCSTDRFLIAKLRVQSLARKHTARDVKLALHEPPQEINDIYAEAWDEICKQDDGYSKKTIYFVAFAGRPLSSSELQMALAIRLHDKNFDEEGLLNAEDAVRLCRGLVVIDENSKIVRMIRQLDSF